MYMKRAAKWWVVSVFVLSLASGCANHTLVKNGTGNHTLTIDDMGDVWASGNNDHGQLGLALPRNRNVTRPMQIPGLQNIVRVYAKGNSSYAIDGAGYMYAWGENDKCQLGNGNRTDQFSPVTIITPGLNPADNIWKRESSGTAHKLKIHKDGSLWASGNNDKGQLGQGNTKPYAKPVAVLPNIKFKSVYALNDYSRAISENGDLYVWGNSLYRYMGYDVAYPKPLLTATHLTGVGKIHIIDIWNQKDTVPHTSFLPLNKRKAIVAFTPIVDGGKATRADGTTLVWGDATGSCTPKEGISKGSDTAVLNKTVSLPHQTKDRIALEITNSSPYTGEPITLLARVSHNAVRDVRFIVNRTVLAKCKVPVFGKALPKQGCVFNDYINMAGLILKPDKPNTLKGLVDSFQDTVALTRYKAPNTGGTVEVSACATFKSDNKEECTQRKITVKKLACEKTKYGWELYQPGKWALSAEQINDIFRLAPAMVTSPWGPANTAEPTDSDLTKGIVNFLGRDINTMLKKIDLSQKNIVMTVDAQAGYSWLPVGQAFHWNPIHKTWITTKKMQDGKLCVTHVSRDFNINFRTAERDPESVFTDGFKVPSYFKPDPGAQTITTSQIYHVVVAGKRSRTSYISTSENFKWTYWVAGYDLGRHSQNPYNLYTGYTWNGLVSKVHTTRGDQAEISVPYSMAGHNILGVYKLNRPQKGPFSFKTFTLNKNFYPQTIDYIE